MNRKKIFTKFYSNNFNKNHKVKRLKKGELVDNINEIRDDMPEEEGRQNVSYNYLYFFCFLIFFLLIVKIIDLQLLRGDYFYNLAKGNRIRSQIIRAPRGIILDRNGVPLVKNIANFQVIVELFDFPKDEKQRQELINSLSSDLKISAEEIAKNIISENSGFLNPKILKENLDQETAIKLKLKYKNFPSIIIDAVPTREYLDPNMSHVLGYLGRIGEETYEKNRDIYDINDYIGKSGLEASYEEVLKGRNGKRMVEVDANGRVVRALGSEDQSEPRIGNNIITSLDTGLQTEMVGALKSAMDTSGSKAGSVIAINPQNGNILGMVSLPSFDNNLFTKGIKEEEYKALIQNPLKPMFNRSISGTYPPGSIVKPFIALAALEEKVITRSTTISDGGSLVVKNMYNPEIEYVFRDWKPQGHGQVNVIKAIAESCDVFFYYVGGGFQNFKGLGASRLEKYMRMFGLGSILGVDLPNEASGLVPNEEWKKKVKNETWYTADNYHLAIGQGDLLTTPLQAANWTSVIANRGIMYKPLIAHKIIDNEGKIIKDFQSEIIKKDFVSPVNMEIVREGMRTTVTNGTARLMQSLPYAVAAKTGTAQYGPNNSKEHAWFIAFAPYDNPEIALVVLVEGGGQGSTTAGPVAKRILEYYFSNK